MYNIVSSSSGYTFPAGVAGYSEMIVGITRIQVGFSVRHSFNVLHELGEGDLGE